MEDNKFKFFQKKIIEHLSELEAEENREESRISKSLATQEFFDKMMKSRGYEVGTVREWKGKKYKKIAQNKWVRVYDKDSSSARRSIGQIKHMAEKCTTSQELLQLVLKYRDRFSDENGHPLPIVQELSEYVSGLNDKLAASESEKPKKAARKKESQRNYKEGDSFSHNGKDYTITKIDNGKFEAEAAAEETGATPTMRGDVAKLDKVKEYTPKEGQKLSNGKTVKEMREKYGIKTKDEKPAEKNTAKVGENLKLGEIVYFKPPYEPEVKLKVVGANEEGMIVLENVKTKETERISEGLLYRESGNEEGSWVLPKNYATEKKEKTENDSAFKGSNLETVAAKYATDKEVAKLVKKTDSVDFTSQDVNRFFMCGTYQDNGYVIATDGKMLSMIKADYPAEEKWKVKGNAKIMKQIAKDVENYKTKKEQAETRLAEAEEKFGRGSGNYKLALEDVEEAKKDLASAEEQLKTGFVDGQFPNYKRVIPDESACEPAEGFEDFDKVMKTAMIAAAYSKFSKRVVSVRVGNKNFDARMLVKCMAMAKKHGLTNVITTDNNTYNAVSFSGKNGAVVLMPMNTDGCTTVFYGDRGTAKFGEGENSEEFLSAGEKEKSDTDTFTEKDQKRLDELNEIFENRYEKGGWNEKLQREQRELKDKKRGKLTSIDNIGSKGGVVSSVDEAVKMAKQIYDQYGATKEGGKKLSDMISYNIKGGSIGRLYDDVKKELGIGESFDVVRALKKVAGKGTKADDARTKRENVMYSYADEIANIEEEKAAKKLKIGVRKSVYEDCMKLLRG